MEVELHTLLTSVTDGGDVRPFSRPVRITPQERAPESHWIGGSLGPTADLNA